MITTDHGSRLLRPSFSSSSLWVVLLGRSYACFQLIGSALACRFSSVSNNRFAVPSLWMPGRRSARLVLHEVCNPVSSGFSRSGVLVGLLSRPWGSRTSTGCSRFVYAPHGRDLLTATLVHLLAHTHTLRLSLVPSARSFSTDFFPFAWKRRLLGQWLLGSSISTSKVPRFHLVLNYFPPPW